DPGFAPGLRGLPCLAVQSNGTSGSAEAFIAVRALDCGSAIAWFAFYTTALVLGETILLLGVLLWIQISRGQARRRQTAASDIARPILQDAFVQFLAGGKDEAAIRKYLAGRGDVEDALL